ncbi:MAG: outer membrane beta-barrel protein [Deltaproteobacteria bacterium]
MKREKVGLRILVIVTAVFLVLLAADRLWAGEEKGDGPTSGFYVSFTPSIVFPFSVETTSPGLTPAETRAKWGAGIGGSLGYRYSDFRVEGEIQYGRNEVKDIRFVGGGGDMSGYYDLWGATINFFYDIPTGVRFRPYVGAGLGAALFEAHDITLDGFPPTRGSNKLFTYRLMAGVSYALANSWRLLFGYRFMGIRGPDFETGGIPLYGGPLQMHAIQAGVQFYF